MVDSSDSKGGVAKIEEQESRNQLDGGAAARPPLGSPPESIEAENRSEESGGGGGDVLFSRANVSFRRRSSRLNARMQSRLIEPLPEEERKPEKTLKSGLVDNAGSGRTLDPEEFLDEDVPDDYMNNKIRKLEVFEFAGLLLIVSALASSLLIPVVRRMTLWDLKLWKWFVMVLVLICGRLVSGWAIRVLVFIIERNFVLRKRVLYFVYGLRASVQNCFWFCLVLLSWYFIFDKKVEKEINSSVLPYVTKALVGILVGTVIWLLKTLIVKVLASSFHVSTFFDRIQDSLFNQYVIETLSGPPLIARTASNSTMVNESEMTTSPRVRMSPRFVQSPNKNNEEITIDHLHKLNQRNISAWNMKRLMNIILKGTLYTLDERILNSELEDESQMQIQSEYQAREAARKIFKNIARPGLKHIHTEDLLHFMREDEASKTMHLFDGAIESGGISKAALKKWMVNAFRERRSLALSLNDTHTAVDDLHRLLGIVVAIIIAVIWLLIIGIQVKHFIVVFSSQFLLVVFIFGNTCKNVFEAIIFLFVVHPFDVGDRCEIDGVQMIVEEMNIMTTVFLRYDNQKIVFPNTVLATKPISNYYRSPDMGDAVDFCIHIATPPDTLSSMRTRIIGYIEGKPEHWHPKPMFVIKDVEVLNGVRIAVWLTHRMNHQDMKERWVRRAFLVEEMVRIFRDLDIDYRFLPLNINVRRLPTPSM